MLTFVWLGLWVGCGSGDGAIPLAVAERGPFEVTLAIQGELKAVRSVSITTPDLDGPAKVTWVAEEGARVEAGDEVIRFDEVELRQRLEEAQNNLEVARTKIDQKKAQQSVRLADLEKGIEKSQLALSRAEMRVTDSDTVPRVEREGARISVREATLSMEQSQSALASARLEGAAAVELLRLQAEQSQNRLERAERALASAAIHTDGPGLVILPSVWKGGSHGPVAVGDTLWAGSTVVELPDLSEMRVEAWVHEVDAAKVATEQPVSVVIDAFPDPPHEGTIDKVADLAVKRDRKKSVKHLRVDVGLTTTSEIMKPGMTVRAEIQVQRLEDVLAIPQEAVFHDDEGEPFVYVPGSFGSFAKTPIELGITNDSHVVVEEGLSEGTEVALVDPEAASLGDPPRPGIPAGPAPGP